MIFIFFVFQGKVAAANDGYFASGHGNLVMEGSLRTFSFNAREFKNGDEIRGSFELKNRQVGVRAHADLDCLRIEGNEAFLSGVLTQVNGVEGSFIGDEVWFHVKDNGEGRGDPPDQISLVIVDLDEPPSVTSCDEQMDELELQNIIGGNVQIGQR